VRSVAFRAGERPGVGYATVDMGPAVLGEPWPQSAVAASFGELGAGVRVRDVSTGNRHVVVLVAAPASPETVARVGRPVDEMLGGRNVELVWPGPTPRELTLGVWERGVGLTLACGTGTCAAAAAAQAWGMVGAHVVVHNPGGALEVTLPTDVATMGILLGGPVAHVADIEVSEDELEEMACKGSAL